MIWSIFAIATTDSPTIPRFAANFSGGTSISPSTPCWRPCAGPDESKFCWTAETSIAVRDWWLAATPDRRDEFLQAVASGQLDITAMPLNQTPTLNRRQWQKLLHWLPEDLWQRVKPQSAIQNDVNGMPRAGAVALLDRGVRRLFFGINSESGGPPQKRPSAFWWKMPDGRRMFVWLGDAYPDGYSYFEPNSWRRGPVPEASDTRYRPPRPGEILPTDEASMRKAHGHLVERLAKLEAAGYPHETLLISMTNEWRIDGDPPFPPLADFVAAWHRLGLKPTLRLTTVSTALRRLEQEIGPAIAELEGEWTDWWANGVASGPREVAASRLAKRIVAAAESPSGDRWTPTAARPSRKSTNSCACSTSIPGDTSTASACRGASKSSDSTTRSRGRPIGRWPRRNCCFRSGFAAGSPRRRKDSTSSTPRSSRGAAGSTMLDKLPAGRLSLGGGPDDRANDAHRVAQRPAALRASQDPGELTIENTRGDVSRQLSGHGRAILDRRAPSRRNPPTAVEP